MAEGVYPYSSTVSYSACMGNPCWMGGLGAALELWHRLREKGAGIKTNIGALGKERREQRVGTSRGEYAR